MRIGRKNLEENFKLLEEKQGTTNQGITLIALVVTIVVLLILASVSITVVFGDNGILQLAKEAGEKTNEAVQNDKENIGNATNYIKSLSWDTTKVTAVTTKDGAIVPVPKGFVGSEVDGENTIKDGFVIYEGDSAVTNENVDTSKAREERNQFVWVPADGVSLEYKQDKETWKEKASDYNDYTDWTDNEKLKEREASVAKYGGFYVGRYEAGVPESKDYTKDYTSETKYQDKANEANRNKSEVEEKDLPASKKGLQSWNYISQENAKALSEKMYESSTSVTSRLIDSYAWDTICHWLSDKVSVTESKSWGNYVNADSGENVNGLYSIHSIDYDNEGAWTLNQGNYKRGSVSFQDRSQSGKQNVYELATGISEKNKAKNIYDFAGNMWEWTTEIGDHKTTETVQVTEATEKTKPTGTYAVFRGGAFDGDGSVYPAAHRHGSYTAGHYGTNVGFRPVLYIR